MEPGRDAARAAQAQPSFSELLNRLQQAHATLLAAQSSGVAEDMQDAVRGIDRAVFFFEIAGGARFGTNRRHARARPPRRADGEGVARGAAPGAQQAVPPDDTPVTNDPRLMKALDAIDAGDADALRSSIALGADVNGTVMLRVRVDQIGTISTEPRQPFPLLSYAAASSCKNLCQILLEAGSDPDFPGYTGMRPLHSACTRKDGCGIVQLLIEYGANVDLRHDGDNPPLYTALWYGCRQSALTLLRAGAGIQVLLQRHITKANAPLNDYMIQILNAGGFDAHVKRHRCVCLGVIDRCVGDLPEDVMGAILRFWTPPGGR